jgi:hypothetical protein
MGFLRTTLPSPYRAVPILLLLAGALPVHAQSIYDILFPSSQQQQQTVQRKVTLFNAASVATDITSTSLEITSPLKYSLTAKISGDSNTAVAMYTEPQLSGNCVYFAGPQAFIDLRQAVGGSLGSIIIGTTSEFSDCRMIRVFNQPNFMGTAAKTISADFPQASLGFVPRSILYIGPKGSYSYQRVEGDNTVCTSLADNVADFDIANSPVGAFGVFHKRGKDEAPCAAPFVRLFDHYDFGGSSVVIQSHVKDLTAVGWGGRISGAKAIASPVALYSGTDFTGACSTITGDVPRFESLGVGNDTVKSVRVNETCPGYTRRITLYEAWDYQGRAVTIESDIANLAALGFDNVTSSVRHSTPERASWWVNIAPETRVALYENPNFTGACSSPTSDIARINNWFIGNDRASSVRIGQPCPKPADLSNWGGASNNLVQLGIGGEMGPLEWVDGPTELLADPSLSRALKSGTADGVELYVCRTLAGGEYYGGKYFNARCNYPVVGGSEVSVTSNYQLLINKVAGQPDYMQAMIVNWDSITLRLGCVTVTPAPGRAACRGIVNGGWHPGWTPTTDNAPCYVGWGGAVHAVPGTYANRANAQCLNIRLRKDFY